MAIKVDGVIAVALSKDANFLQEIARKALEQLSPVSLDTHTAEEILEKYKSNEDNLCLAGKYTLEDSAIILAMTEYASLRENKAKRWISVKEELPPIGRKVFIIDDYIKYPDNVFSGIYYGAGVWHKSENITPCPKGRVTHWMPLPKAPELKKPSL